MKKFVSILLLLLFQFSAAQVDLSYYLPDHKNYNSEIPTPEEILGFQVGKWHVSHDKLVEYMRKLASSSDRISIENRGTTYEDRPLLLLTITSPQNHENIEEIQQKHVLLTEKQGAQIDTSELPVVVYQGFSIHGNEPSGANAGLLLAYHLAASEAPEVIEMLENTIILFDPSFNPDGLQRFAQWVNTHKSIQLSTDPNDREYNEVWPRGRTNHYWFDMNRDWLPVQLNESKARIKTFTEWLPNVLTDHHEMGSNATFFFQPGIPSRVNPLTPAKNQVLTQAIGKFHAKGLNKIGSLYYTEESYDDFYYGKGSTYPDVNGAIGILFEQASSRGHAQETENGILTFPFSIRNQLTAGLTTLEAANAMRKELLNYQRSFFENSRKEGERLKEKALLIGNKKDATAVRRLVEVLLRHDIKVHATNKTIQKEGKQYPQESSYIIPLTQKKQRLVRGIFSEQTKFTDSLFYDVSAWTLSHAFDVNSTYLKDLSAAAAPVQGTATTPKKVTKADYAYLFEGHGYYTPRAIYRLISEGIRVKVGMLPFGMDGKKYDYGTLMVPVANQTKNKNEIFSLMETISKEDEIEIRSVSTGLTQGIDLGSRNFKTITQPEIAVIVGDGVRSYDAGEIWYVMDTQYQIPITKLDVKNIGRADLSRYTHIVLPSYGGSQLNQATKKIQQWVQGGGHLIAYRNAIEWLNEKELIEETFLTKEIIAKDIRFDQRDQFRGAQALGGSIFNAKIDRSHPLNFGIENDELALFRNTRIYMSPDKESYNNPLQYTDNPMLSGYISEEQLDLLKGSVPFKQLKKGKGSYLLMTDNTNFRAFWLGTQQLLANMIFYANFM